jgi:hypothetical protein
MENGIDFSKVRLERISHAACISESGWIFIGKCHADCLHKMHHVSVKYGKGADKQGFITNEGRYVQRGEAAKIALSAGQIDFPTTLLFSENLWDSVNDNGKYDYDEIKGYIEKEAKHD